MSADYALYEQANRSLEDLLGIPVRTTPTGPEVLATTRRFLDHCGAPDRTMACVLVGGTSGKGSVAALLAAYLHAAGVRVGLHISPYVQVATEKISIGGTYIGAAEFAELTDWVLERLKGLQGFESRRRYGIASLAMAAEAMRRHRVEIGVFEVGCGGRFDPVNALDAVAVAITTVGMDHLEFLGPTLRDIAWHKAGLIKSSVPVITAAPEAVLPILQQEAQRHGAHVRVVQADNIALAGGLFEAICGYGPPIGIESAGKLPARLERMPGVTYLDGAHNPQKMAYLHRHWSGEEAVIIFGVLGHKSVRPMLKTLSRLGRVLVVTPLDVRAKQPCPVEQICLAARGFEHVVTALSVEDALQQAQHLAQPGQPMLVTGSLYLAGQARGHWYPPEQIIKHRTSWPPNPYGMPVAG
ncbi:MAG: hypothetical protein H7Y22_16650 [Gemmatimonadaceae bacterium]|nr:hypothetical protein [Gloeobacterales cyanobacterium ES-bin-141]